MLSIGSFQLHTTYLSMRPLLASLLVVSASFSLLAQDPVPAPVEQTPSAKSLLTPEQMKSVLTQLDELEKTILAQRGLNLGGIIQKLRAAAGSDAAALSLIEDCEKLVLVERRDGDRDDAKRIEQRIQQTKKGETKKAEEKEGDEMTGVRLALEYLALTLEAHESKDVKDMIPKALAFHQSLLAQGEKLKGRAGASLMAPVGGGGGRGVGVGIVVEAYQLQRFLQREGWPLQPADIMGMYERLILPSIRQDKNEDLATTWDAALNNYATFTKARLPEGEFAVWQTQTYPELRWNRAEDLFQNGTSPVLGLAEMLKVIKEFPNHPSSPQWVVTLRGIVAPAKVDEAPAPVAQ